MPQNAFFLRTRDLLVSQKTTKRHFFPTLHPLSTVIFATATVLAFVLLRDSRFNFHRYTQREATPTQKSARKCAATSRDFLRERLESAFTLPNQLRWIAQYYHHDYYWVVPLYKVIISSVLTRYYFQVCFRPSFFVFSLQPSASASLSLCSTLFLMLLFVTTITICPCRLDCHHSCSC